MNTKRVGVYLDPRLYDAFRQTVSLNFTKWLRDEMEKQIKEHEKNRKEFQA